MVQFMVWFIFQFMVQFKVWYMVRGTGGFYLNNIIPLRPFESVLDNVLLDHGGLPCILPFTVHLDLEHLPDTLQG